MGLRSKASQSDIKIINQNTKAHASEATFELPTRYEDDHRVEFDVIEKLKSNIAMLDDLQQRLGFMNTELESIIGSRTK